MGHDGRVEVPDEIVGCGPAGHLALEDQPEAIGDAIAAWYDRALRDEYEASAHAARR